MRYPQRTHYERAIKGWNAQAPTTSEIEAAYGLYAEISDDLRPYIPDDDDDLWWEYYNQYANAWEFINAGIVYIYVPAGAETQFRLFRKDWNLHRDITLTAGQWNRVEFDIDFVVNESIAGFMIQFVNPVDGLKLSGIYGAK